MQIYLRKELGVSYWGVFCFCFSRSNMWRLPLMSRQVQFKWFIHLYDKQMCFKLNIAENRYTSKIMGNLPHARYSCPTLGFPSLVYLFKSIYTSHLTKILKWHATKLSKMFMTVPTDRNGTVSFRHLAKSFENLFRSVDTASHHIYLLYYIPCSD